jgi:HD-GYP domain-containing protein (c-di-GMP phosphodiesterase class II)
MTLPWRIAALSVAFAPVVAYFAFRSHLTTMYVTVNGHFFVVAGSSLAAAAVSVLITRVAIRRNDFRAGIVGVAFTVMAGLLAIHGLSTPGFILEEYERNAVIGLAGAMAVPAGGILLALAVIAPPNLAHGGRWVLRAQIVAVTALLAFGAVGLLHPALIPAVPVMVHPWVLVELIPTAALYALVANHALRTHRLTRRRADLWVAIGMIWLGSSIILYLLSTVWTAGFWGAHTLEALGFVSVAGAVAVDLARQRPSNMLFERLGGSDLIESEETLLGGYVRSLTATLEEHDPSTGLHSRHVAQLAVRVGEHMGLPPHRVRRLAIAGLVHDIGKLEIDTAILQKPGPLTDDEYEAVKEHPRAGAKLLRHLGGFDEEVAIVEAHHERWAGGGYPDGLSGDEVPLEARILTVCDVYDALTEKRSYRDAWPAERAAALIRDETGTTFDPDCADALLAVLAGPEVRVVTRRMGAPSTSPATTS